MNTCAHTTGTSAYQNSLTAYSSSKPIESFATYRRYQPWSLPDSMIYYITKNPSTPLFYQKIIQSCKYFFIKNPLLVSSGLSLNNTKNKGCTYLNKNRIDLKNVASKIWITEEIFINTYTPDLKNSLPSFIIPKIYQNDIKNFTLWNQDISYNEFMFFVSKCKKITVCGSTIKEKNGVAVVLEKLVESLPSVKDFRYKFGQNTPNVITSKTAEKLLKIPHFSELNSFDLDDICVNFDIDCFYNYIKKNKKTKFYLRFSHSIPDQFKLRLQTIIMEILSTENRDYRLPFINFHDSDPSYRNNLWKLYNES